MRYVAVARIEPALPPPSTAGWRGSLRKLFFSSRASSIVTVLLALLSGTLGWQLFTWGIRDAVFSAAGAPQTCRAAGAGACWAVIGEKLRLILFGTYPYAQQWRPAMAMVLLLAMYVVSAQPRFWNWRLPLAWAVALGAFSVLMFGGVLGLAYVPDDQWGGLPVTSILATLGLVAGFALAIPLALVRHAPGGGIGKALVVAYIELARSVPLLAVLFLASVMIPLFLPQGMDISKLLRVIIAFALFTSAYLAEVIRGGLMSVPGGQRRGGRGARARPLRHHDPHRATASPDRRAAGARQCLHRLLQGDLHRRGRRHLRPDDRCQARRRRRPVGGLRHRDLPFRGRPLLRLLLCDVVV